LFSDIIELEEVFKIELSSVHIDTAKANGSLASHVSKPPKNRKSPEIP